MKPDSFFPALNSYEDTLRSYALSLTRNSHNAQDLVQETFFRATANREKYAEGTNLKAWLLTIMRNIFINDYRRKARRPTVLDPSEDGYLLHSLNHADSNAAESGFVMADLWKSIESLDPDYQLPFRMHYEGFKYQEIADRMKLPLGTVKSRIFFARKQIMAELKSMGFER